MRIIKNCLPGFIGLLALKIGLPIWLVISLIVGYVVLIVPAMFLHSLWQLKEQPKN